MKMLTWKEHDKWHYLVTEDGEVVGSISAFSFPFCCFIHGAKAGDYVTLEIAKEKLLEKVHHKLKERRP